MWRIVVRSAVIDPTDAEGGDWDQTFFGNALPDPYVLGALSEDNFYDWVTDTIDDTLTPVWDEAKDTYAQADLLSQGMIFEIRDSDGLGVFETISACLVSIDQADLDAGSITLLTCGDKVTNFVFDLVEE